MHNNYFFLDKLCKQLHPLIRGGIISNCYSQTKDEIAFAFLNSESQPFYLKGHLQSSFSCLSFPKDLSRSKKNSVDLFAPIIGKKVIKICSVYLERAFVIELEDQYSLVFKMHGNRSNILLVLQGEVIDLFHKKMKNDYNYSLLNNRTKPDFKEIITLEDLKKKAPFLLGVPEKWLIKQDWLNAVPSRKAGVLNNLFQKLQDSEEFYILKLEDNIHCSILEVGFTEEAFNNPIECLNRFFIGFKKGSELSKIKREWLNKLNKKADSIRGYIQKGEKKLKTLETKLGYRNIGDLIMANLHQLKQGDQHVELSSFEDPAEIVRVKLKPSLSPQKNAENFYRKAKNQGIEIEKLQSNISSKEAELVKLNEFIAAIDSTEDLKTLRKLVSEIGDEPIIESDKGEILPFHRHSFNNFQIYVGKNARSNDLMIQKHATKNDLWLHAKDTQGSHVIIKQKGKEPFPKMVIEKAAQLAAFYSKRKGEALCPVSYTERKFIRKRKGDPPGAVVVDREKVIMVEPSDKV